jgi:two-component system, NarL family, response regulator NreC
VLADDHPLVRKSLREVLEHEGIDVIAEAVDQTSTIRLVVDRRPDVLVLDLSMPDGSGMETISLLRERAPDTGIVMVTMQHAPSFARAALARGALGFVLKELADTELGAAVRAAARGERYLSPRVSAAVAGAA